MIPDLAAGTTHRRQRSAAVWLALLAVVAALVIFACARRQDPVARGDTVQLAFRAPGGVGRPATAVHIAAVERAMANIDHVRDVRYVATSADDTVLFGEIRLDGPTVPMSTVRMIVEIAEYGDSSSVAVEVSGPTVGSLGQSAK